MNFLPLLFPAYFRRLRWEIAGWWIFSAVISFRALAGVDPDTLSQLASAEIIVAVWILLRLALIDDVFGTLAGRQWRPIRAWQIGVTRLLLSILALLPPLLLRLYVWDRMGEPDAEAWQTYLGTLVWPLILNFAVLGLCLQLAARVNRWFFQKARRVASVVFLVLAAWLTLRASGYIMMNVASAAEQGQPMGLRDDNADDIPGSELAAHMPAGSVPLGGNYSSEDYLHPTGIRELLRFPLRPGSIPLEPGTVAEISTSGFSAEELQVQIRFRCRDARRASELCSAAPVVVFPSGYYATNTSGGRSFRRNPVLLLPFTETTRSFEVPSPAALPWREGKPEPGDAEVILYARDKTVPPAFKPDPCLRYIKEGETPVLPTLHQKAGSSSNRYGTVITYLVIPEDRDAKLKDQIRGALLMLQREKPDPRIAAFVISKGRDAVPLLLDYPAWTEPAWQTIVRPLLLEHATAAERPALLARLPDDSRLAEIFRAKGWQAEAVPVLRERLAAGLPLSQEGFGMLLETRDPALAADLQLAATRSRYKLTDLDEKLRNFPGFDWKKFAIEGWHQVKYRTLQAPEKRSAAVWAASEGDASALRYVAEQAVLAEEGYAEDLRKLVAGEPHDAVARVKENFAAMQFDPASGKWK